MIGKCVEMGEGGWARQAPASFVAKDTAPFLRLIMRISYNNPYKLRSDAGAIILLSRFREKTCLFCVTAFGDKSFNASALRSQFTWTHHKLLLSLENDGKREYYIAESAKITGLPVNLNGRLSLLI